MTTPAPAPRHWIGTISRDHILIGVAGGFVMLNHGKLAPLLRLAPGDGFACYSPRTTYPDGAPLKAFTAIGTIADAAPVQVEMQPGFAPFRRRVDWLAATETPIAALKDALAFTRGNWGMLARRGLFEISAADFATVRAAMTGVPA